MIDREYRLDYLGCLELLQTRLAEPAPSRIQLLTGPRQVGKTTLLLELAEHLGTRALYAAADSPEAVVPGFWERLWLRAEDVARAQGRAVVLLDEVHVLHDWAPRLKSEWDRLRRRKSAIHVVATGSSSLRLDAASRESLAGRFERITLPHWSASDLARTFGTDRIEAAHELVRAGAYPGAWPLRDDLRRWTAYVRDSILEPAIGRDLLALTKVRKPALLRQVFGACVASPAQIVSLQKLQGQLVDRGALETIAHYLQLLEEGFLVAALEKHSERALRRRAAPPKIVILNNALLAVSDPHGAPDPQEDPARFGRWVENACLAHACNRGQRVSYWREEPLEVDAVIEGSWGSWAVEVKTGRIAAEDFRGLQEFTRRAPQYRALVLCDSKQQGVVERAGLDAMQWDEFLLGGPPGTPGSTG